MEPSLFFDGYQKRILSKNQEASLVQILDKFKGGLFGVIRQINDIVPIEDYEYISFVYNYNVSQYETDMRENYAFILGKNFGLYYSRIRKPYGNGIWKKGHEITPELFNAIILNMKRENELKEMRISGPMDQTAFASRAQRNGLTLEEELKKEEKECEKFCLSPEGQDQGYPPQGKVVVKSISGHTIYGPAMYYEWYWKW